MASWANEVVVQNILFVQDFLAIVAAGPEIAHRAELFLTASYISTPQSLGKTLENGIRRRQILLDLLVFTQEVHY